MKNTRSELYKILSLPLFWRGVAIVIGITIFFTFQNIQVINAIANGNTEILMLEDTTSQLTEFQTVRDAVLSSPYQSSILFFPILFALILSTEYKFGQESLTKLLTPKWQTILTGQICSGIIVASTLTVALSLINSAMLYVMLDETLQNYLSLGLVLEVTLRIIIFAITLTLLSMFLVKITRKPIPSVIVIVSILIITLSGILKVVSPTLENLLPLIGAKSFVFGRVENNNPSEMYGLLLLLSQASIVTILLYIKGWYKNQKDKKYG
ncbi:TPA: hypothetical protein ACKCUQ_000218 [Streptococcus pneumoniae]|nr:hypothetical protein [Streptococcus pneumoniae]VJL55617.1 ABC superfamily ATP binding cassette transporter permease subunit [Streptococcus pneumoniae]VKG07358.1 ABC superfamily ATP binding cassette transporter permease subunit [Streptococcus pneumoniae]VLF50729.1 ABC superfamily ATP binding cassette transporter permease subunit [Streptococcus pneumoniae]VLR60568.1 ABC superfamily ATP binding cassette transporter permease subunit [Streptococcus pneumoniae]